MHSCAVKRNIAAAATAVMDHYSESARARARVNKTDKLAKMVKRNQQNVFLDSVNTQTRT